MALTKIQPKDIVEGSRRSLNLPKISGSFNPLDEEFLAALLRRNAGFLCPCSAKTLRFSIMESLQYLIDNKDSIERIDRAIEGLITGGDLLELSQVATDDPSVRGTWLFAAPPSYIVRPNGGIFLAGIVADQDTYLSFGISNRIQYEGYFRKIISELDESLDDELTELGFQKISHDSWLKCPPAQPAEQLLSSIEAKLQSQSRSGAISDLQLLDPAQPVTYYRGRWIKPVKQTGIFVGRRPQEYGSPIWCLVELKNGEAKKLLDFPLHKSRWRGCDYVWYLQMAIDHVRGTPQLYRLRADSNNKRFDFFSPLPLWAERRLMIIGHRLAPERCLLSYSIPNNESEEEERFLQEHLWLMRQNTENKD